MAHGLDLNTAIASVLAHDAELVTAHSVRAPTNPAYGMPEAPGELDEHAIAGSVAVAVVVRLESVEVREHEQHGSTGVDRFLEICAQSTPIVEPRERVTVGPTVCRGKCRPQRQFRFHRVCQVSEDFKIPLGP